MKEMTVIQVSELAVQDVQASSQQFRFSGHVHCTHYLNPNPVFPWHTMKDGERTTIMMEGLRYGE